MYSKGMRMLQCSPFCVLCRDKAEQNTQCIPWTLLSAPVNQLFADWISGNAGFVRAELLVQAFGVVPHVNGWHHLYTINIPTG